VPNAVNADVDKFLAAWGDSTFRGALATDFANKTTTALQGKGINPANVQDLLTVLQGYSPADWDTLVAVRDALTGKPDRVKAQLV
jgi:hypothetical protein